MTTTASTKWPIAQALDVATHVVAELRPFCDRIEVAGSIRRKVPFVKDIEVVAQPSVYADGLFGDVARPRIEECRDRALSMGERIKAGPRYTQVGEVLSSPFTLDLFLVHGVACSVCKARLAPAAEPVGKCPTCGAASSLFVGNDWGLIYGIRTGPAGFAKHAVSQLKGKLWRSEDGWIRDDNGCYRACPEEEDFFRCAGVPFLAPEKRRDPPGWRPN